MSTVPTKDGTELSEKDFGEVTTSRALFIIPTRRGDGLKAGIHGHMLELADPTDHRLARAR